MDELTEIEIKVLEHFYKMFIKILYKTWSDISSLNFRIESSDTNANAIQIVYWPRYSFTCCFWNHYWWRFSLSICYPISYIEPLLNKIVDKILVKVKIKNLVKRRYKNSYFWSKNESWSNYGWNWTYNCRNSNEKKIIYIVFNKNASS